MRHGFLLLNKPIGPSSHDCVAKVRSLLMERKVGHLGTLDPAAEGLLVLAVGAKALKVVELFKDLTKEYKAQIRLGAVSSTYDREGIIEEVILKPGVAVPDQSIIQNVIADRFIGKIDQVPPGYSAVKVGGERAYRKMRQGRGVDLPPREVEITDCDIVSFNYPDLTLHISCSSGTYIRSLAHDLGGLLRCGGYLSGLKRTKVGEWLIEDAVELEETKWSDVIPLKEILANFPRIDLTEEEYYDIRNGRDITQEVKPDTFGWFDGLPIAILIPENGKTHARKVL